MWAIFTPETLDRFLGERLPWHPKSSLSPVCQLQFSFKYSLLYVKKNMREKLDKNKDCVLQWFLSDLSFCFSLNFISWPHEVYFVLGARNTSSALWRNLPTKVIIINIWRKNPDCLMPVCRSVSQNLLCILWQILYFELGFWSFQIQKCHRNADP